MEEDFVPDDDDDADYLDDDGGAREARRSAKKSAQEIASEKQRELKTLQDRAARITAQRASQKRVIKSQAPALLAQMETAAPAPAPAVSSATVAPLPTVEVAVKSLETLGAEVDSASERLAAKLRAAINLKGHDIVLFNDSGKSVADYFAAHRDKAMEDTPVATVLPVAFANAFTTSAQQLPGTGGAHASHPPDDAALAAQRRESARQLQQAHLSAAQHAAASLDRTLQNIERKTGHIVTHNTDVITWQDIEDNLIPSVCGLPACSEGPSCMALTSLPVGDSGIDDRLIMKAYQPPALMRAFHRSGQVLCNGEGGPIPGACVACLMFVGTVRVLCAATSNEPAGKVRLPFTLVVDRPGGIRSQYAMQSHTMPGPWLEFVLTYFVPAMRTIKYTMIDPITGTAVETSVRARGYHLADFVKFNDSLQISGATVERVLEPRLASLQTTQIVGLPSVEGVLARECLRVPAIDALLQSSDSPTSSRRMSRALQYLCAGFQETLGWIHTDGTANKELFAPYYEAALSQAGDEGRRMLGEIEPDTWSPATHSVLAAAMWRAGFAHKLVYDHAMNGNHNVDAFARSHVALLQFIYGRWIELRHPPSDDDLLGDKLGVVQPYTLVMELSKRALLPSCGVPYMTPYEQFEVCPELVHSRVTPAMETVRSLLLADELRGKSTSIVTHQRRQVLAVLRASYAKLDAHDLSLFSVVDRSPLAVYRWFNSAIVTLALQVHFDDSLWLLRELVVMLPEFPRIVAAMCSEFPHWLPSNEGAQRALRTGDWGHAQSPLPPAHTLRSTLELDNAHALLTGVSRYTGGAVTLPVIATAAYNTFAHPDYYVVATLALRIHVLQTLVDEHTPHLRAELAVHTAKRTHESTLPAEPLARKSPTLLQAAQRALSSNRRGTQPPATKHRTDWDAATTRTSTAEAIIATLQSGAPFDEATLCKGPMATLIRDSTEEALAPLAARTSWTRASSMGAQRSERSMLVYSARVALFEHLEMAAHVNGVPGDQALVDSYFYDLVARGISRLETIQPLPGTGPSEDALASLAPFLSSMEIPRESHTADNGRHAEVTQSWVMDVRSALPLCCYIRDFRTKHWRSCSEQPRYVAWAAQALLASVLGVYRHSVGGVSFARALELHATLAADRLATPEGTRAVAAFLIHHTYMALVALRENLMLHIQDATALQAVLATVWPNFEYVQQCWVPELAEAMRVSANERLGGGFVYVETRTRAAIRSEEDEASRSDAAAGDDDDAGDVRDAPRVFRRMRPDFFTKALAMFSKMEVDHWTQLITSSTTSVHSLPPIGNMIRREVLNYAAYYIGQTDPNAAPRLEWYAHLKVSARGMALLSLANFFYTHKAKNSLVKACFVAMDRADFIFVWMVTYMIAMHRDCRTFPLSYEVAARQYNALRVRAQVRPDGIVPPSYAHISFCHLLGCGGVVSFFSPNEDMWHYGCRSDAFAIDLGASVCVERNEAKVYAAVARRSRESDIGDIVKRFNAIVAAARTAAPEDRARFSDEIARLSKDLETSEKKNVSGVVGVMMTLPCTDAPLVNHCIVGSVVVRRNELRAREIPQAFTACTKCGTPTLYSIDRYGSNGFSCGCCDRTERLTLAGVRCFGCGANMPATTLPLVTGEAAAQVRADRSDRNRPQGSTTAPKSVKAHQRSIRSTSRSKRHCGSDDEFVPDDATDIFDLANAQPSGKGARGGAAARKTNTATESKLGENCTSKHIGLVRLRNDPFTPYLIYDDREVYGTQQSRVIWLCSPCKNHVPADTVFNSAGELLHFIHAEPKVIWVGGRRIVLKK